MRHRSGLPRWDRGGSGQGRLALCLPSELRQRDRWPARRRGLRGDRRPRGCTQYRARPQALRCRAECQGDRGGSGSRPELAGAWKRRRQDAQGLRSASPKVLEPVGRHFGVPDSVLNVLVPEVVLQGARVVAIIGELKTTGMAQHVWVDRERHLGSLADALDEAVEANRTDWHAALGNEHVGVLGVIATWLTERSYLVTADWMYA